MVIYLALYKVQVIWVYEKVIYTKLYNKLWKHFVISRIKLLNSQRKMRIGEKV